MAAYYAETDYVEKKTWEILIDWGNTCLKRTGDLAVKERYCLMAV